MEMPSRVSKVTAFKIQSKITWLKQKKKKKKNGKKPQKYITKQIKIKITYATVSEKSKLFH